MTRRHSFEHHNVADICVRVILLKRTCAAQRMILGSDRMLELHTFKCKHEQEHLHISKPVFQHSTSGYSVQHSTISTSKLSGTSASAFAVEFHISLLCFTCSTSSSNFTIRQRIVKLCFLGAVMQAEQARHQHHMFSDLIPA